MRIFVVLFVLFTLMECAAELTSPRDEKLPPPPSITASEELVLSRDRTGTIGFEFTTPAGFATASVIPEGGIAGIVSMPERGVKEGMIEAAFRSGLEAGEASLTLVIIDEVDQSFSLEGSIRIVETAPPTIAVPQSLLLSIGMSATISFPITTPGKFASAEVDGTLGTAMISSEPAVQALDGEVMVRFTAGDTAGDGSATLTIKDVTGQSISETVAIDVIATAPPSVTPPNRSVAILGESIPLIFTITAPGGLAFAVVDAVGGDAVISSQPNPGDTDGEVRVDFTPGNALQEGSVTVMVGDVPGQQGEASVAIDIRAINISITPPDDLSVFKERTKSFSFQVAIPDGLVSAMVSAPMGGTAMISSMPELESTEGEIVVAFTAGAMIGPGGFTLTVTDMDDTITSDVTIEILGTLPVITPPEDLTAFVGGIMKAFTFEISSPDGFASAMVSDHMGGTAMISTSMPTPGPGSTEGQVTVDFTTAMEVGSGSFILTVQDNNSQSTMLTVEVEIIGREPIVTGLDISTVLTKSTNILTFEIVAPDGYASAQIFDCALPTDIMEEPATGDTEGQLKVKLISDMAMPSCPIVLLIKDQMGETGVSVHNIRIREPIPPFIINLNYQGVSYVRPNDSVELTFTTAIDAGLASATVLVQAAMGATGVGFAGTTTTLSMPEIKHRNHSEDGDFYGEIRVRFDAGANTGWGFVCLSIIDQRGRERKVRRAISIKNPITITPLSVGPFTVPANRRLPLSFEVENTEHHGDTFVHFSSDKGWIGSHEIEGDTNFFIFYPRVLSGQGKVTFTFSDSSGDSATHEIGPIVITPVPPPFFDGLFLFPPSHPSWSPGSYSLYQGQTIRLIFTIRSSYGLGALPKAINVMKGSVSFPRAAVIEDGTRAYYQLVPGINDSPDFLALHVYSISLLDSTKSTHYSRVYVNFTAEEIGEGGFTLAAKDIAGQEIMTNITVNVYEKSMAPSITGPQTVYLQTEVGAWVNCTVPFGVLTPDGDDVLFFDTLSFARGTVGGYFDLPVERDKFAFTIWRGELGESSELWLKDEIDKGNTELYVGISNPPLISEIFSLNIRRLESDDMNTITITRPSETPTVEEGQMIEITFPVTTPAGFADVVLTWSRWGDSEITSEPSLEATSGDIVIRYTQTEPEENLSDLGGTKGQGRIDLTVLDQMGRVSSSNIRILIEPSE